MHTPQLFGDILIIILASLPVVYICLRLKLPLLVGLMLTGIAIGPYGFGLIKELEGIEMLAEIGVLLLLLQVGMEMDLGELSKVGKASMMVALIGVALPFAGGALAGVALGHSGTTSLFIGAALTATSVGITARVFGDLRALATTEARIVLGAAVADDVLGLVILTVVVKIVVDGNVGVGTVVGTLGLAIAFLLLSGVVGLTMVPKILHFVQSRASSGAATTVVALVIALAFAQLADAAKLAFIIGAFMAGLAIGSALSSRVLRRGISPLTAFGVAEILVGVTGLISPLLLDAASFLYAALHQVSPDSLGVLTVARLVSSFAILAIPTAMMGITLPLLSAAVSSPGQANGTGISLLYAINTLGCSAPSCAASHCRRLAPSGPVSPRCPTSSSTSVKNMASR